MALFTVSEARAFGQGELASTTRYHDADIEAMAALVGDYFAAVCGVSFEPKAETDAYVDGEGTDTIWVPHHRLQSVTAVTIYDATGTAVQTFDSNDLSDLAVYASGRIVRRSRGVFDAGERNVKLSYTHGWTVTPPAVKRAALRLAQAELIASDVSSRVTNMTDPEGTRINFSVAGRGRTEWTGIPLVDTVLRTYNESIVGMVR